MQIKLLAAATVAVFILTGCGAEGPEGPEGRRGPAGGIGAEGTEGQEGLPGQDGSDGQDGLPGQDGKDAIPGRNTYLTGPGLKVQIQAATIDSGAVTVRFKVTDDKGIPLDRTGLYTEGTVSTRFLVAWLDETNGQPLQYTAYTTNSAGQASYDSAGNSASAYSEIGEGLYEYRFAKAVTVDNPSRTHTIGFQAERTHAGLRYSDNGVFHFLPAGGTVSVTREVVDTQSCNGCHNRLQMHGTARRDVQLCITCHNPQSVDPDTGNTVSFPVLIHKIHAGPNLPSVKAGTPYQIIGYGGKVFDYSKTHLPQDVQNCATCHAATAADADLYKTRPTRESCGSCHDRTSFEATPPAGWTAHTGGAYANDQGCAMCHAASGGLAGIVDVHRTRKNDASFQDDLVLTIVGVENSGVGQKPELVFSLTTDGVRRDLFANPVQLRTTIAGPTSDYRWYQSYTVMSPSTTAPGGWTTHAGATLVEDGNNYRFTFPAAIPTPPGESGPYGSYGVGMEAYGSVTIKGKSHYWSGHNPVAFFAVTDNTVQQRRKVVEVAKCNSCHLELGMHGSGARREAQYCAFCHNSERNNSTRMPWWEGQTLTPESADFKVMIHKIHMGAKLTVQPYLLGGMPTANATNPQGTQLPFGELHLPGRVEDCQSCHLPGTEKVPLSAKVLPTRRETWKCDEDPAADTDEFCQNTTGNRVLIDSWYVAPTTAVCTSCHDSTATVAHANLNTWMGVEACSTCHGAGSAFDTAKYHKLAP